MSYLLDGTEIRRPSSIKEQDSKQYAQHKALNSTVSRDSFGSAKRIWVLNFRNCNATDYATLKTIRDTYRSNDTTVTWESTETNYTIASTNVHIDMDNRGISIPGTDYLSDFSITLTEE